MAKNKPKLSDDLPKISILLISILVIYWSFGQKTTFYYTLVMVLSIVLYRQKEIKELFINDIVKIFKED